MLYEPPVRSNQVGNGGAHLEGCCRHLARRVIFHSFRWPQLPWAWGRTRSGTGPGVARWHTGSVITPLSARCSDLRMLSVPVPTLGTGDARHLHLLHRRRATRRRAGRRLKGQVDREDERDERDDECDVRNREEVLDSVEVARRRLVLFGPLLPGSEQSTVHVLVYPPQT